MIIKPFIGVDDVLLGNTKEQIRDLIGTPDECKKEGLDDGNYSEEWLYVKLGMELYFVGSNQLDYISVSSREAILDSIQPINMCIKDLIKEIPEIKFEGDCDDNEASYTYEGKGLSFWVVDGRVTEVTIFAKDVADEEIGPHSSKAENWNLTEKVEREFTSQNISYWPVWIFSWLTWIYMVSGFAIGGYCLWPFLEQTLDKNAIEHGLRISGLLYDTNFGLGLLVFLFVWIILAALLTGMTILVSPLMLKHILFWAALDDDGGKPYNKKALKVTLEHASTFTSAKELIHYWCHTYIGFTLKYIVPLTIIGVPTLYLDMTSYAIYTEEGIYRSHFLPWKRDGLIPWNTADYVELGCNQTDDGPSIVYDITFKDGSSKRIEDGIPFTDYSWLESLEIIDQKLSDGGARFRRWVWLERDPLHPKCIQGYYGYLGKDRGDRLMNLLRVGEFKNDTTP